MSKLFKLEIITPLREFLSINAEAVTINGLDGEMTVLADHAPMVAAIEVGALKIKENGNWKIAFCSEGFIDVRPDEVLIFSQTCEWPEEIDVSRAEEAKNRALEKISKEQALQDYKHTSISLARAMVRLKISKNYNN